MEQTPEQKRIAELETQLSTAKKQVIDLRIIINYCRGIVGDLSDDPYKDWKRLGKMLGPRVMRSYDPYYHWSDEEEEREREGEEKEEEEKEEDILDKIESVNEEEEQEEQEEEEKREEEGEGEEPYGVSEPFENVRNSFTDLQTALHEEFAQLRTRLGISGRGVVEEMKEEGEEGEEGEVEEEEEVEDK